MATKRKYRKNGKINPDRIGNSRGIIQMRIEKVTPQQFGVGAIDCAKVRLKYMFCDFFGRVILPPTEVEHGQAQMKLATVQFQKACWEQGIRDVIVAVEVLARLGVDRLESKPEAQGTSQSRLDGAHDNVVDTVGSATHLIARSFAR